MVDDLVTTCQTIIKALRTTSKDIDQTGLVAYGHMLRTMATELEAQVNNLLEAPPDNTPPSGIYLRRLVHDLNSPRHWPSPTIAQWLASELIIARRLVRELLGPAEITGDAEIIARAQTWLGGLDEGPDISNE